MRGLSPSGGALALSHLLAHFGCKIFLLLLDARADLEADDRRHLAAGVLQVLLHRLLVVLDERLAEQRDLAEPLAHLALDDLGDDLLRLAGRLRVVASPAR